MELASRISMRAKGNTYPNPHVGAIIVKNGIILSRGWTGKSGLPHAEIDAINKIKNKKILEGASLYCTLEPCSHYGKSSPCVDQILKNKIKNVFIENNGYSVRVKPIPTTILVLGLYLAYKKFNK